MWCDEVDVTETGILTSKKRTMSHASVILLVLCMVAALSGAAQATPGQTLALTPPVSVIPDDLFRSRDRSLAEPHRAALRTAQHTAACTACHTAAEARHMGAVGGVRRFQVPGQWLRLHR